MGIILEHDSDWVKRSDNNRSEMDDLYSFFKQLGGGNDSVSVLRARLGLLDDGNTRDTDIFKNISSYIKTEIDYRISRADTKKRISRSINVALRKFENTR